MKRFRTGGNNSDGAGLGAILAGRVWERRIQARLRAMQAVTVQCQRRQGQFSGGSESPPPCYSQSRPALSARRQAALPKLRKGQTLKKPAPISNERELQ